jgi:two-component system chemotaxis sensor kinase CheA
MSELEQFKATYFAECSELLAESEETLAQLEQGAREVELLHAVFRAVHSIKGGAGAFGFDELVSFTHSFETLLDLLRDQKIEPTSDVVTLCIRGLDIVADLVASARDGKELEADFGAEVKARIEQFSGGGGGEQVMEAFDDIDFEPVRFDVVAEGGEPAAPKEPEGPPVRTWLIRFAPHRALFERANEPLLLLRELFALGEKTIVADVGEAPPLSDFDPARPLLTWNITLKSKSRKDEVEAVFEFVEGDCELSIREEGADPNVPSLADVAKALAPTEVAVPSIADIAKSFGVDSAAPAGSDARPSQPSGPASKLASAAAPSKDQAPGPSQQVASIRVDLDKIDRVVDMVGELVITQAMLTQQIDDHLRERYPEIVRGLEVLAQHTRSLQDSVMSIRAQPVKSVFARMPRLVRELSIQLDKKVRLEMVGETTEIDKTVIEQLSDPLTHMIRNSLDHGIEKPEKRIASGKPEEGVIRLSAEQAGGRIIIQVADDGGGINRERVKAKAIERGIIAPEAQLSDEEIDELIFAPGFSTAEAVTNVSGRGVGMDVVRQNIQKLGGRVGVKNNPGRGAVMTLTLPLTLAVLDIMLVRVGTTPFVVPLASIIESMQIDGAAMGRLPSGGKVLRARGDYVQVIELASLFGITTPPSDESGNGGFVILCETDGVQKTAIVVDHIIGQQQVVIKSLEANFERLEGIAGATILGDGSVALILDVAGLKRIAEKKLSYKLAA